MWLPMALIAHAKMKVWLIWNGGTIDEPDSSGSFSASTDQSRGDSYGLYDELRCGYPKVNGGVVVVCFLQRKDLLSFGYPLQSKSDYQEKYSYTQTLESSRSATVDLSNCRTSLAPSLFNCNSSRIEIKGSSLEQCFSCCSIRLYLSLWLYSSHPILIIYSCSCSLYPYYPDSLLWFSIGVLSTIKMNKAIFESNRCVILRIMINGVNQREESVQPISVLFSSKWSGLNWRY